MARLALAILSAFLATTHAVPWGGPVETPAPVLDGVRRHDRPNFAAISTVDIQVHAGVFQPTDAYPVNYCGWIDGVSSRPTGCASKSSCIMNSNHGALGCCGASSTSCAVYTTCVDAAGEKSPQDKNDILTCKGKDRCYKNYNWFNLTMWACGKTEDAATIYSNFTGMPTKGKTLQIIITGSGGTTKGTQTAETTSAKPTDADTAAKASESEFTPGPSSTAGASDSGTSHKKKNNAGAIAGGVVGGLAAVALIAAAIFLCLRRSNKIKAEPPMAELESPKQTPVHFQPVSSVTTPQPTTPGTPGAFSRPESSIVPPPGHHHTDPPVELP